MQQAFVDHISDARVKFFTVVQIVLNLAVSPGLSVCHQAQDARLQCGALKACADERRERVLVDGGGHIIVHSTVDLTDARPRSCSRPNHSAFADAKALRSEKSRQS